jgi:hypothetical protein
MRAGFAHKDSDYQQEQDETNVRKSRGSQEGEADV